MRLVQVGQSDDAALVAAAKKRATPILSPGDLKPLLAEIGRAKIVMLGEASHGTHEFYEWRRIISEHLLSEHGFRFIAVEGDWPPCWKLNNYIHAGDGDSRRALRSFRRWPTWMWANTEIVQLADWMRGFNTKRDPDERIGFYGLDVYSLFESIDAALGQLSQINPFLARLVKERYACFEPYGRDERAYSKALLKFPEGCREEVAKNLRDLLEYRIQEEPPATNVPFGDALFDAQQNARIVADAEKYYRTMMHGTEDSWNVRDRHMLETLEVLLHRYGPGAKGIVWAHNTHIGDYKATDMAAQGQINIGGLAREKWGTDSVALVGFGTYQGEVVASHSWDGPIQWMNVPPALPGSYECAFHKVSGELSVNGFWFPLRDERAYSGPLSERRGHRAIGVVYHPARELWGNYVPTSLAHRYDAFLFFNRTRALEPIYQGFQRSEIPETWPEGF